MLLEVNADQRFFVETSARFLDERAPAAELRRLRGEPIGYDPAYWQDGAQLGWTSLLVEEAQGGGRLSDHGLLDLALLATEFGRHASPGPLLSANVVAAALSAHAVGESSVALDELLTGESLTSWCPDPRADGRQGVLPTLWVEERGEEVVVRGSARPVEAAGSCGRLLVSGHTGDGWTQVLVPVDAPGVAITPLTSVDLTRRFSVVSFDQVILGAGAVVGEVGTAGPQVAGQRRIALALATAESVGAMHAGFDMTVEWAFDRYSFGRPLASYQELKHRFADMKTWLEAGHAVSNAATLAAATEAPDAEELLSAAKAFVGDYGSELLQDCVQMHGGIGVTFDHDLHLVLRRHTLDRTLYGTPADHRQRLANLVDDEDDPRGDVVTEDLESFRQRARSFIVGNLHPVSAREMAVTLRNDRSDEEELAGVARDREVQRMLFEAGLAGVCVPTEYGGQGLTPAHQQVLNEELAGYEFPSRFQAPTLSPCAAVLLDFGTEEQKRRHIPAILRGEEFWMQFLSEPSGGSDVAAALTTAVRDGDSWILNGSKIWTTGAWWADWGLCLARTNWDVPKHRGLSVFMLPIHQPGIEVHRIEMVNGSREFCQEFMTDVVVPDSDRLGDVDEGWTVGTRWMFHERMLMNSPLVTIPLGTPMSGLAPSTTRSVAADAGRLHDLRVRDLIGEARMLDVVGRSLARRLHEGIVSGEMSDQSGAIGRLFTATAAARRTSIAFEIAGEGGGTWSSDDGDVADCGTDFLMRQVSCIGGGTTEMARNVISERVLGMPREQALDRGVPFRDVPRGQARQP